jgi:hypothetical protein
MVPETPLRQRAADGFRHRARLLPIHHPGPPQPRPRERIMKHRIRLFSAGAVLLSMLVLVAACGDAGPTASELRPDGLRVGSVAQAVMLPYATAAGSSARLIDVNGGVLHFGIGFIKFPPGAVDGPTRIEATVEASTLKVRFSPHGLHFPAAARPSLRLNINGVETASQRLQFAYVNESGVALELLPTSIDLGGRSAITYVSHFSTYVMGAH